MIFPRIRMCGGNCQTLSQKGEKPMCHLLLFYSNYLHLIISAGSWETLWQLIVLGVGWQDCQSMHPRTLHPAVDFGMERGKPSRTLHPRRFFFLSPQVAEHPCTEISCPSYCLFIHRKKRSCFSSRRTSLSVPFLTGSDCFLTHRNFPGF